jgi:flagellar assembly protein FliH
VRKQGTGNREQGTDCGSVGREPVLRGDESAALQTFDYPDCPDAPFVPSWSGWYETSDQVEQGPQGVSDDRAQDESIAAPNVERRLAEEARRSFAVGRVQGIEEGRKAERAAQANALLEANAQRTRQVAELIETFAQERGRYFHAVEQEVVRLALAVAARILGREAESDPLFLIGAMRAALGQISGSTEVRLRVPAAELDLWTEAVELLPHLSVKPKVTVGANMHLGDCVIETSLGTADLGMRAQMAEIERTLLGDGGSEAAKLHTASMHAEPVA